MKNFLLLIWLANLSFSLLEASSSCAAGFAGDESESFGSGANDIVVVQQDDGSLKSTLINVQVGKFTSWSTFFNSREGQEVKVLINGQRLQTSSSLIIKDSGKVCFRRNQTRFRFRPEELNSVNLKIGLNQGQFVVEPLSITIPFNLFYYQQNHRFVLTDIDGTITESDIKGRVFPMFGFAAHHQNVVELFDKINDNGYEIVYLTARSMAQDIDTRQYLFKDLKDRNYTLPIGPVFMSPKSFAEALADAVTDPSPVKAEQIKSFSKLFNLRQDVILGAYGNRNSDTKAYMDAGISTNLIYLVNEKSILRRVSDGKRTSYYEHATNVNQLYPSIS